MTGSNLGFEGNGNIKIRWVIPTISGQLDHVNISMD